MRGAHDLHHRASPVDGRRCDLILVLRDGTIAESGSFAELLRRGGVFAELYNTQFVDSPTPESRIATSVQPS